MKQLPGELDTLARGQEEIAGEQARIEQAAAAERERLLEQTRREIDLQLRAVRRDLVRTPPISPCRWRGSASARA